MRRVPYQPIPLLVLITCVASPNLQFVTVDGVSVSDIETKCVKEFDATTGKPPLLIGSSCTVLNSDFGTVGLGGGGQTFSRVHPRLDEQISDVATSVMSWTTFE